jgi:hypothetical protein
VAEGVRDRDATISTGDGDGERASPLAYGEGKNEEGTGGHGDKGGSWRARMRLSPALWILQFRGACQSVPGGKIYEPT